MKCKKRISRYDLMRTIYSLILSQYYAYKRVL